VLDPIAAATAVLNDDEKELGVALIDIGGGTTDIAIYTRGALRYTTVLPIAGEQITNDLAYGLTTPPAQAEEIKRKFASLHPLDDRAQEEEIEVPGVSGRQPRRISRDTMMRICRPRVEEILGYIQEAIRRSGYHEMINAGVVLTGGTAAMPGLVELCEDFLQMPTRLGLPQGISGNHDALKNPANATGVGLILHGRRLEAQGGVPAHVGPQVDPALDRLKRWFKEHF
jgi:cell division protein FtsA